jgi:thymidylate synthase
MHVIRASNLERAYQLGLSLVINMGHRRPCRGGKEVREVREPVTTMTERPRERVLLDTRRNANPFFHLHESLWMLGGCDEAASVAEFNARMKLYDRGDGRIHGAYGRRWQDQWPRAGNATQLDFACEELARDKDSRRAVISMWDREEDIPEVLRGGPDVPCNTHIYCKIDQAGRLRLTVCCRSNDVLWGTHGANAVHFSMLQEYLAARIGVPVGQLYQVSDSYHAYSEILDPMLQQRPGPVRTEYERGVIEPSPLFASETERAAWDGDLHLYLSDNGRDDYLTSFFGEVAEPMRRAWRARKDADASLRILSGVAASDWRMGGCEWIARAAVRRAARAAQGAGRPGSEPTPAGEAESAG